MDVPGDFRLIVAMFFVLPALVAQRMTDLRLAVRFLVTTAVFAPSINAH